MHKHIKKIIAVVLVLTMAISAFVINTTAQSSISRIVRNVSILVDLIKIQNNNWDNIGHIIGHDADDIDKDDVEALLGGADLGDVVDALKNLANAGIDADDLTDVISGLINSGNKISISDFIDILGSSAKDPGCIDKDLLAKVFGCIVNSKVDADNLGDILKTIVGSIDFPDSNLDTDAFGSVVKVIISAIKNVVDTGADSNSGSVDIDSSTVDVSKDAWTGTWSTSMTKASATLLQNDVSVSLKNVTARNRVTASIGGSVIRITLSNEFGTTPLKVGEVTAAIGDKNIARAVNLSTMTKVTFGGKTSVTIPAGQTIKSDPIKLDVKALDDVVISAYYENVSRFTTVGLIGGHCYASLGNNTESYVTAASIDLALEKLSVGAYEIIPVLSNIDIYTPDNENACSAVFFGDSTLTNTIPKLLAAKLQGAGIANVGVLQQAIKGNELLRDGQGVIGNIMGEAGLKRFNKDAITQPGCKYIFVKIGINDIIHPNCATKKDLYPNGVELNKLIAGYKTLIDEAHKNGKTIIFFTLTPFKGYTRDIAGLTENDLTWTQDIDNYRLKINEWMKSADCDADYVIDLSPLNDAVDSAKLIGDLTLDGAHFTAKGCQAVVDLIPLEIFGGHSGSTGGTTGGTTGGSDIDINLPSIPSVDLDLDALKDLISGLIKDKDTGCQIGTLDINNIIELLKQLGKIDGSNVKIPEGGLKVVIDLVTGAIKDPSTGIELGKIDINVLKGILDKLGFDYSGLKQIDAILDILKGTITLPDGGIIGGLPQIDPDSILDKFKDIFDKINGGTKDDSVPGTKNPETNAPVTADPAVDPYVDETLEDVDVIDDLIVDDSTPLASVPTDPSALDDMEIANTSDNGVAAIVAVATAAGAIFVTAGLKKKED